MWQMSRVSVVKVHSIHTVQNNTASIQSLVGQSNSGINPLQQAMFVRLAMVTHQGTLSAKEQRCHEPEHIGVEDFLWWVCSSELVVQRPFNELFCQLRCRIHPDQP